MFVKSTKIVVASLVLAALVFGTGAGNAGGSRSGCGHDKASAANELAESFESEISLLTNHRWLVLKAETIGTSSSSSIRLVLESAIDRTVRTTLHVYSSTAGFDRFDQLVEGDVVSFKRLDSKDVIGPFQAVDFVQPIRQLKAVE